MSSFQLAGTFTAIVTPFSADGESVDVAALDRLIDDQIKGGVSGLVPCGTTGESPTLSEAEQLLVIGRTVERADKRVPVLAGTGSNSTKKTVEASRAAVRAGADAVMVVMPYYNKPSQEGMRRHVLEVAAAVDVPIVLYNIPGRSVVDLAATTTEQICKEAPQVVGMKEATGNVLRCQELLHRLGDRLTVMCGDDALTVPMMALGAKGVISVTSNVLPKQTSAVTTLMAEGDLAGARRAHFELLRLHGLMFVEPNPTGAKAALSVLRKMSPAVRGPLVAASEGLTESLRAELRTLGVLS